MKYNGMTAEKFVAAWIRSTFMIPKVLTFGNTNYYHSMMVERSLENTKKHKFHRRGSRHKRNALKNKAREERSRIVLNKKGAVSFQETVPIHIDMS